jgi:5-methylcytosine-specific restriction endonuclease McrA
MADEPCALCGRDVPGRLLTLHHTIPRQRGGRAEHRVTMCRPCHKQVHAVFTNKQLERELDTVEKLKEAPELQEFLSWIRKQKPDRVFRTVQSKTHGRPR